MKILRKVLWTIAILLLLLFAFAVWYKYEFSMTEVTERTINAPDLERKVIIATQGSKFKDSITDGLVEHYGSDSVFIRIVDVSKLPGIRLDDYQAMVILHTWENWKPPVAVDSFVNQLKEHEKEKMVVLSTSGQGDFKMENIDAITGESTLEDIPKHLEAIIRKVDPLLAKSD